MGLRASRRAAAYTGPACHARALSLANLLALKQAVRLGSDSFDEVLAGRQRIEANAQTGEDGAVFGPASGREFAQPISPRAETVSMPKAGFGADGGRRHTRQDGVLAFAGYPPKAGQSVIDHVL